jgi:hypothetical protein
MPCDGSFLLLLLAQSWLMATGRNAQHMRLGPLAIVLAPALVIVGFILAPTMYHMLWEGAQAAPPGKREELQGALGWENILLKSASACFPVPGDRPEARGRNAGMHKVMFLATSWLCRRDGSLAAEHDAGSLMGADLYPVGDRADVPVGCQPNRSIHRPVIWLAVNLPFAIRVHGLWYTVVAPDGAPDHGRRIEFTTRPNVCWVKAEIC